MVYPGELHQRILPRRYIMDGPVEWFPHTGLAFSDWSNPTACRTDMEKARSDIGVGQEFMLLRNHALFEPTNYDYELAHNLHEAMVILDLRPRWNERQWNRALRDVQVANEANALWEWRHAHLYGGSEDQPMDED